MRNGRLKRGVESLREHGTRNVAFYFFCAFIISYFGRLARRIAVLGTLHLDLLLAVMGVLAVLLARREASRTSPPLELDPVAKRLCLLLVYIAVTLPFVEWPGSVLHNLEAYIKSLCFFFLVVATVDTTRKLKTLLAVYVATQVWRVVEPVYMHLTSGYWGARASVGHWQMIDRLSGSPYDIINPNGLGFVIIMTLPMLQFLVKPDTTMRRIVWSATAGLMCYALVLSGSRSGFMAFVFLCLFAIWRSKNRAAWLAIAVVGATVALALMTGAQRERYVSIYNHSAAGGGTAENRITGTLEDFKVSLRRPFFGHGLGTSREANAHFRGLDLLSHDLYTETAQELGYIGLILVLSLIWSFVQACRRALQVVSATTATDERLKFLRVVARSLVVVVAVDLFFSFAAYGLSEPYWYFIGGLSVVTARLAIKLAPAAATSGPDSVGRRGFRRLRSERTMRVSVRSPCQDAVRRGSHGERTHRCQRCSLKVPLATETPTGAGATERHDILALSWFEHRRTRELCSGLGIELALVDTSHGGLQRYLLLTARTVALLASRRPRVLLVQNPSLVSGLLAVVLRAVLGYRLIIDAHNEAVQPYENPRVWIKLLSRWVVRRANLTIVTNRQLAQIVEEQGGAAFILPDRIPAAPPGATRTLGAGFNVVLIATFARDEPVGAIFDAVRGAELELHVTGDPRNLDTIVAARAPPNVHFSGFLQDEDYWSLLRSADAVIDLTLKPNCLVCGAYEALALGKPMLLSNNAATLELFGDGAVFTDNSPPNIRLALERLRNERTSLEAAARLKRSELAERWQTAAQVLSDALTVGQPRAGPQSA